MHCFLDQPQPNNFLRFLLDSYSASSLHLGLSLGVNVEWIAVWLAIQLFALHGGVDTLIG